MQDKAYSVTTQIEIGSPRPRVWEVLTDFPCYPKWGSFMCAIDGQPVVGAEICEYMKFRFLPIKIPGKSFIIHVEPHRKFAWRGSFVHSFTGLGNGTHIFELQDIGPGKTRLLHREDYRGLLVPFLFPLIRWIAEPHFRTMDLDLKRRCEQLEAEGKSSEKQI